VKLTARKIGTSWWQPGSPRKKPVRIGHWHWEL
jgi:hypothetical protein